MLKKISSVFLICLMVFGLSATGFGAEEKIVGKIESIASDGSYIMVEGKKIMTTPDYIEEGLFEVGDKVEITAEKTDKGLVANDFRYIFEEEEV